MRVSCELRPKATPLVVLDKPAGSEFLARFGKETSAVVFVTSPGVYACTHCQC